MTRIRFTEEILELFSHETILNRLLFLKQNKTSQISAMYCRC